MVAINSYLSFPNDSLEFPPYILKNFMPLWCNESPASFHGWKCKKTFFPTMQTSYIVAKEIQRRVKSPLEAMFWNEVETFKMLQSFLERGIHALSFIATSDKRDENLAKKKTGKNTFYSPGRQKNTSRALNGELLYVKLEKIAVLMIPWLVRNLFPCWPCFELITNHYMGQHSQHSKF